MVPRRVLVVLGTRPEAIKLAPVIKEIESADDLEGIVVSTGQHREMLDQVIRFFGVVPTIELDLMVHGASPNAVTSRVLRAMEQVLADRRPHAVVVQGDTTSAFAACLSSFLAGVPVVHVEAGLRTGNLSSPFPEEANRRLTSVIASLHLAPTSRARNNLLDEGIDPSSVLVTGNTVVDALQWTARHPVIFSDARLRGLDDGRQLVLVTTHRRESWGRPMREAMKAVSGVARNYPDTAFVVPLHRNQVVRDAVLPALEAQSNVIITEPLSYPEFTQLLQRARCVVTDSGGIQEEAPAVKTPVLVLRDTTERPEGVDAGAVRLVGTDPTRVNAELARLLDDDRHHHRMSRVTNPYGDGQAARRSVSGIRALLDGTPWPDEFTPAAPASRASPRRAEVGPCSSEA